MIYSYLLLSINNMFQNYYVYSQQPTSLMEFRCNFYLKLVYTFKLGHFNSFDL